MSPYNVMNKESEQEPFSVVKLIAGGLAVALIAFVGVSLWLPPRPAAPAKVTARSWDAALVVAAPPPTPRQAPSAAPPAPPVSAAPPPAVVEPSAERAPATLTAMQPVESRNATALSSRFLEILRAEDAEDAAPRPQTREPPRRQAAREPPRSTGPERNPLIRSDTASIQRKLQELGYYAGDDKGGVWGDASRRALQDFKRMNGLQDDDKRDRQTEAQLLSGPGVPANRTFIGRWALDAEGCLQRADGTQLVIDTRHAETSGGKCDFRSFKQESEGSWRVQAACSASGKSWSSDIALKLNGPRLRWSSERGTETYVRCLKS